MRQHRFHGLEFPVRSASGARALRVVHPPHQRIVEHRHDWPVLTIPTLGGYDEECDDGSASFAGPAAILHPAGRCHANCIHAAGLETFSIEFDPDWLSSKDQALRLERSHYAVGGEVAIAARRLTRLWCTPSVTTQRLQKATASFVSLAIGHRKRPPPGWFATVSAMLSEPQVSSTADIARRLGMHPAWLAHAYRTVAGEGLHETVRRRRLEHAVTLLRTTDDPIAEVAAVTGFCDQSHLSRAVSAILGRTPLRIRRERSFLPSA